MKLTNLKLENFRNYKKFNYDFPKDKELIVIVGPNGTGKTNFLEAIYLLSLGKSFRSLVHDDLVGWDNEYLRCTANATIDKEDCHLEVFYSTAPTRRKNFKKNGVNLKNSEYLGNLLTVLFHPEDLNMLYLNPSLRRRYMDIVLSQTDKNYLLSLSNYKKALKQRNALLGQLRDAYFDNAKDSSQEALKNDLAAWDEEIVEYGTPIITKRLEFTAFLNKHIEKIYSSISGEKERISIEYQATSVAKQRLEGIPLNFNISANYAETLIARKKSDTFKAETSTGPHRDDLYFFINGKNICASASRGEFRTLLLALKLAEIEYIKEKTGKNPILLLDDVFSELDRKRQVHLLKSIQDCQTIITTCDTSSLDDLPANKVVFFATDSHE
ncbi:MAG: DNA replication/repair protein RecF [Candidatus Peregrinibacteria bacterium]|nr:DNA replication/repair protein RecF [Candidatus Peregrinibacteria bacterium]